jgi:hypothetical protein
MVLARTIPVLTLTLVLGLFQAGFTWADSIVPCPIDHDAGKTILENRCAGCHQAPKPQEHSLSEWPAILNNMAPRAGLRPEEKGALMDYIESALKGVNTKMRLK